MRGAVSFAACPAVRRGVGSRAARARLTPRVHAGSRAHAVPSRAEPAVEDGTVAFLPHRLPRTDERHS
jgi:hypothetical protein